MLISWSSSPLFLFCFFSILGVMFEMWKVTASWLALISLQECSEVRTGFATWSSMGLVNHEFTWINDTSDKIYCRYIAVVDSFGLRICKAKCRHETISDGAPGMILLSWVVTLVLTTSFRIEVVATEGSATHLSCRNRKASRAQLTPDV